MVTGCPRVPFTLKDECWLAIAARLQGGAKVETHVGGNAEAVEVGFSSPLRLRRLLAFSHLGCCCIVAFSCTLIMCACAAGLLLCCCLTCCLACTLDCCMCDAAGDDWQVQLTACWPLACVKACSLKYLGEDQCCIILMAAPLFTLL